MRTFAIASILIVAAAATATYMRYGSFDPCSWMEQDMAQRSGLPLLVVQARIRGGFLLDGVTDPDLRQCVLAWWKVRAESPPNS